MLFSFVPRLGIPAPKSPKFVFGTFTFQVAALLISTITIHALYVQNMSHCITFLGWTQFRKKCETVFGTSFYVPSWDSQRVVHVDKKCSIRSTVGIAGLARSRKGKERSVSQGPRASYRFRNTAKPYNS